MALGQNNDIDYRNATELSPSDYLFGSHSRQESVFDEYRTVDLSADLGISGADCGKIDIKNTLQGALRNVLDTKYLGSMGKDIVGASPMLLTCYFSPTWCAILKHSRIRANFLAQLRLNQCRAIDKYTDSKVNEFYEERAECVRRANQKSGGNFEDSMEACKNYWNRDITDWAGGDRKTSENRLIESTAKWAGFKGKQAERVVSLTKAFIGDTVLKRGSISIDYGPRKVQITPRTHLADLKKDTYAKLCDGLITKIAQSGGYRSNIYQIVTNEDLSRISRTNKNHLIDRQSLLSLAYLPHRQRKVACRKLSDAIAMNVFSEDMGKVLDFTSAKMTTNVHLPTKRKLDAIRKTRVLKDQVEMTLALEDRNSEPLNQVLHQINREGRKYQGRVIKEEMNLDRTSNYSKRLDYMFFDCADGIGCIDIE